MVRRTLGAQRVVEDEPVAISLEVHAGTLGAADRAAARPAAQRVPSRCRPTAARRACASTRASSDAGRRALALPSVLVADPLGLASRAVSARASAGDDEILVLPRIEPVTTAAGGDDAARIARRGRKLLGAEVELDGIRPLRDGTPASRIYWPAVAKGADAQERFLRDDSESQPLVVLDPRGAAGEEALDAAVRAAASLAHALAEAGGCGVLLPGDRRATELSPTLAGWDVVHARLAMIGPDVGPALASVAQRRGPVVYVSARMRLRLPQALGGSRGATRVLVVPGALADRSAAFAVAGCSGYVLNGRRAQVSRGPAKTASGRGA